MITNTLTGTTVNTYADALSLRVAEFARKTILLKNTHSSNGLHYKLLGYAYPIASGIADTIVTETTLVAGAIARFQYREQWFHFTLQVKSAVADSHATYQVDYSLEGGH